MQTWPPWLLLEFMPQDLSAFKNSALEAARLCMQVLTWASPAGRKASPHGWPLSSAARGLAVHPRRIGRSACFYISYCLTLGRHALFRNAKTTFLPGLVFSNSSSNSAFPLVPNDHFWLHGEPMHSRVCSSCVLGVPALCSHHSHSTVFLF